MTNIMFSQKAYDEALELAEMARSMILQERKEKLDSYEKTLDINVQIAKTKITARLASVISWSMFQKAFEKGEITKEEALKNCYDLFDSKDNINEPDRIQSMLLSENFKKLIERSSNLYLEVQNEAKMIKC